MSLQPWVPDQRVFGVSNRHSHRSNILHDGCKISVHTSEHVLTETPTTSTLPTKKRMCILDQKCNRVLICVTRTYDNSSTRVSIICMQ